MNTVDRLPNHPGWVQTYTRRAFDFDTAGPVDLRDVAYALGRLCRYNGHTSDFYSVAEHSTLVADLVYRVAIARGLGEKVAHALALLGLYHDGHEAYIGDVTSPMKRYLGGVYDDLAARIDASVLEQLGLPDGLTFSHGLVHKADRAVFALESITALPGGALWPTEDLMPHIVVDDLVYMPQPIVFATPSYASASFLYDHERHTGGLR